MVELENIKGYLINFNESKSADVVSTSKVIEPKQVYFAYDGRYYVSMKDLRADTIYSFSVAAVSVDDINGPFTESIACRTYKAGKFLSSYTYVSILLKLEQWTGSWKLFTLKRELITRFFVGWTALKR